MQGKERIDNKDKKQHSSTRVPYSYYECSIPEDAIHIVSHWHSELEISLVTMGQGEFVFDDERHLLKQGDIIILPPDILHGVNPVRNHKGFYKTIVFHHRMLGTGSSDRSALECIMPIINGQKKICPVITGMHAGYPEILSCVEQIMMAAKMDSAQYDLLLKSELLKLFWLLDRDETLVVSENKDSGYSALIRPAIDYMNERLAEDITVKMLADYLNISKSHFMFCFKKSTGVGAIEYLNQCRIRRACLLLSKTRKPVSDIACACGYGNISNFNRQFKKNVGRTPKEYRIAQNRDT